MTMRFPTPARHVIVFGFFAVLSGFLFFAVEPAFAITIVPLCARAASLQTPSLDCVLETFRSVASLIVGITGSFALLMFVYGGFMWVTSAGSAEKVKKGKQIFTYAVIGLIVIFGAYAFLTTFINALDSPPPTEDGFRSLHY